ncbi:hypothetical protein AWB80_03074 [Caballeronia pedi]|uniref:Uncharacterized protein n=1 Tax=Caballeronia pedi TaxID=1777141 RepID=A0A158B7U4_9BURK|nr:hypothetical protein [Caballeronia pedi]SAK65447.1 hypothetical protein AWB80_03074 [Caballeronia pedi]
MSKVKAKATTGFMHGKNYRKGDDVHETPEVIADLEKAGLVKTEGAAEEKAALVPSNKKAPEPENKSKAAK